jgi:hypothetical protein
MGTTPDLFDIAAAVGDDIMIGLSVQADSARVADRPGPGVLRIGGTACPGGRGPSCGPPWSVPAGPRFAGASDNDRSRKCIISIHQ